MVAALWVWMESVPVLSIAVNNHTSSSTNHTPDAAVMMERIMEVKRSRFHRIQMPRGGSSTNRAYIR